MSQHGSMTPDPSYTGKTIPPIPDLHDSNGDGFWGPPVKVTDEAVEAAAAAMHPAMWREHVYVDPEPMRETYRAEARTALEAAAPLLQVQVDREALWEEIVKVRDASPRIVDDADTEDIVDAVLALLSPKETK